jgi:hypothetical protein
MRLRYFRVRGNEPHQDTKIVFGREDLLGLEGSLHFLVGINGTGKSRLLQALVETLMCLEQNEEPSYFVTLACDLPHPETDVPRTILFHKSAAEIVLYEYNNAVLKTENFEKNIKQIEQIWYSLENENGMLEPSILGAGEELWRKRQGSPKNPLSMSTYLPSNVLVYTSGAIGNWEQLLAPKQKNDDNNLELLKEATHEQEVALRHSDVPKIQTDNTNPITVWVRGEDYRAALLAAVLQTASKEFDPKSEEPPYEDLAPFDAKSFDTERKQNREIGRLMPERYDESFRSILDEINWLYPVTASLTFTRDVASENAEATIKPDQEFIQESLKAIALNTQIFGDKQSFHFDLRARMEIAQATNVPDLELPLRTESLATRLLRVLSSSQPGEDANAFGALRQLLLWQRRGYLQTKDIRLTLKKLDVPDPMTLESLSDGERMFLGRMALMQLIGETRNALVILDEPETHFNDYWKREMVDIIDRTLEHHTTDVLLTTHSSIAITDAFSREINRLFRTRRKPDLIQADHPKDPTFGATPTEVLQEIFEGPRSVGQRAAEFLDTLLVLASYPEEVLASWQNDNVPTQALQEAMYESLLPEEEMGWQEPEQQKARGQLDKRLIKTLKSLGQYGEDKYAGIALAERLPRILKEDLLPKIGAGYYRFEFSRRLLTVDEMKAQIANQEGAN